MPRVDLPEILLEIAARTKFTNAFTHLTESSARVTDIVTSLCAILLAQACNTGPEPFTRQDTPSLRRDRLMWIDQNYIRDDTLVTANGILVAAQSKIALAQLWGGGDVASADGMHLVVPVRSVHVGPNPKYFHRDRDVTWYNLISDQRSGLNSYGQLNRLAQAIAEIGRIDKTIHTLNYIDDKSRRRSTLLQLNLDEGQHSLARDIFHGKRGELHQRYREGQEDQLSALGLVVNIVVLWNTI